MIRIRTLPALILAFGLLGTAHAAPPAGGGNGSPPRDRAPASALRTGILYDRVLPLSHIERFDGSESAAAITIAGWRQLYDELRRAADTPFAGPDDEALREAGRRADRDGAIRLALVNARYERTPAGPAGGPGGPPVERRAFAVAALKDYSYRGADVHFVLRPGDCFGNERAGLAKLEADLDDGAGFRDLALERPVEAHYAATGRKIVRVRATLDDGTPLHAAFAFEVRALQTPLPNDTLHITATDPYQGSYGTGDAYVYLAPQHSALVNPVVVVEGFDLDNTMNWDELYQLLNQQGLVETLRGLGFDAVVLNFTDATDYVQRNTLVLTELLRQVQDSVDPQTSVALVGASMGALVSRLALAYLESQHIPHRVRTFISFDGPHAGANIPLGIQYWTKFFSSLSTEAAFLLGRLNTPAAKQLLVYHLTDPPGTTGQSDPLRGIFLADLAAVGGWPSLPRRVAIANGSGSRAGQGFAPADQIILYEYSSLLEGVTGDVWAVPDAASHVIFNGQIRVLLFVTSALTVTVSGTQAYDSAPGGSRPTMTQMDTTAVPYGDIVALHGSHCFIPTISALALDTPDLLYDVAGDPDLLAHTPFQAVYFPSENQEHMTITAQSAAWFVNEITGGALAVRPPAPAALSLASAPNPFRAATRVSFSLASEGPVSLRVFGVDGRAVCTLSRGRLVAGAHELTWRGSDDAGRAVPPGLYFLRLEAAGQVETRRVARLR